MPNCVTSLQSILRYALSARTGPALVSALIFGYGQSQAENSLSVSASGTPNYSFTVPVPPGIANMAPDLGLLYNGNNLHGAVGHGWAIQGISSISRCPGIKRIDGVPQGVNYDRKDKLCLDGHRLIQADANGQAVNGAVVNPGITNPFQDNDALGGEGMIREYRSENDSGARIRAYGSAGGDPKNGPAYFKVWTRDGHILEYGVNSNTAANALIHAQGKSLITDWPVSRISDRAGNYIDFLYDQRDVDWGSALCPNAQGGCKAGHEWNLTEIKYTGNTDQLPNNRIVFSYADRPDTPGQLQDRSERYTLGSKSVNIRLLKSIQTYVNWPGNQATPAENTVKVKSFIFTYDHGPVTNRSRLTQVTECAGMGESTCLPPTSFTYTSGSDRYKGSTEFSASSIAGLTMLSSPSGNNQQGNLGVLLGDFFGTGRTDILRWSDSPAANELYQSNGDGSFSKSANFNINDQNIFKSDGCYSSIAADFNGDGMTDILRMMRAPSTAGSCGEVRNILYLSGGNGSFTPIDFTAAGINFLQIKSTTYISSMMPGPPVGNQTQPNGGHIISPSGGAIANMKTTLGRTFYFIDVNNDGLLDIVTTEIPESNNFSFDSDCRNICTHIYLGKKEGGFSELLTTNLSYKSAYADPPMPDNSSPFQSYKFTSPPFVADVNGDGMPDLRSVQMSSGIYTYRGSYISRGDGNFDYIRAHEGSLDCLYPIDFNGDGHSDCIRSFGPPDTQHLLVPDRTVHTSKTVENFNLDGKTMDSALFGMNGNNVPVVGFQIADINGDGRDDIIRWADDASLESIYLSNGDGTFQKSTNTNLLDPNYPLHTSDGRFSFIAGDFTGQGNTELLRLASNAGQSSQTAGNILYVKESSVPPDLLLSVKSGTGLSSEITWVPLTNSSSGSLGARYVSDRNTPYAAAYPIVDHIMPGYIVATVKSDTGVNGEVTSSEYSYRGSKFSVDEHDWLGFRERRHQILAPDSTPLTMTHQVLQSPPYMGILQSTKNWIGELNQNDPQIISSTSFVYCDTTSTVSPNDATSALPCTASAKIRHPYLAQTSQSGTDLNGAALPTVETKTMVNANGDPTQIIIHTSGTALGLNESSTRTVNNIYFPDLTTGDSWSIGQLEKSTVTQRIPNSIGEVLTSVGSAPDAALTSGAGSDGMPQSPIQLAVPIRAE